MLDGAAAPVFKMRPRPFRSGLSDGEAPDHNESAIDGGVLRDGKDLPPGYGVAMDERVVEYPWLFARLRQCRQNARCRSTFNHDFFWNGPPLRGADLTIMTLAPEKRCYWYQRVFLCLR